MRVCCLFSSVVKKDILATHASEQFHIAAINNSDNKCNVITSALLLHYSKYDSFIDSLFLIKGWEEGLKNLKSLNEVV